MSREDENDEKAKEEEKEVRKRDKMGKRMIRRLCLFVLLLNRDDPIYDPFFNSLDCHNINPLFSINLTKWVIIIFLVALSFWLSSSFFSCRSSSPSSPSNKMNKPQKMYTNNNISNSNNRNDNDNKVTHFV